MADELKPFTCSYRFEGSKIDFTCHARNWDEVSARLRAIGTTAIVEGEQVAEVGAGVFGEALGRALTGVRALAGKRNGGE
ncbi:hypothetical protein [Shinella sp.]|jgi:hypothetical protein|uniref:hypothetical protein n=1 Tax=Shinella sp. TaxID=1870904 RepID=UPI003F700C88